MTQEHLASGAHGIAADVEPPAPPRALTGAGRWRSWAELRVRVWLIMAVMMLIITAGFGVMNTAGSLAEEWLIDHGLRIDATLIEINGTRDKGEEFRRSDPLVGIVKFTPAGGEPLELQGFLYQQDPAPGEAAEQLRVGQEIPIFIDPNDPTQWTDRLVPRKWTARYVATLMMAPLAVLLVLAAVWQRRGVLNQWRMESAKVASVHSWKATAIAPLSYRVAMALTGGEARIFEVLIPKRMGVPQVGDEWWVIVRRGRPRGSIVAAFYGSGTQRGGGSGADEGGGGEAVGSA
jgi:hypothetical protein